MNERMTATVGARIGEFRRKMATVNSIAKAFPNKIVTTVEVKTKKFQGQMDKLASTIKSFGIVGDNMIKGGLLTSLPMLAPIITSLTGALGTAGVQLGVVAGGLLGLASSFSAAALGAGGLLPFVVMLGQDLALMSANTKRGSAEWNKLSKTTRNAIDALGEFQLTAGKLQVTLRDPVYRAFTQFLKSGTQAMKMAEDALIGVAGAFENLGKSLRESLNAADIQETFNWFEKAGPRAFENWGKIAGYAIRGVMNLMRAFDPLAKTMEQGLLNMTKRFSEWAAGLSKSEKFEQFIQYVKTNGPKLVSVFGNITMGLVGMFTAFAPLAADMMTGLQNLTARFKEWGQTLSDNQQFQKFVDYIRETGPQVIDLIGNITTFLVNMGVAMAPLGQFLLKVTNGFLSFTNSLMQSNPWIGQIMAGMISLMGVFRIIVPAIMGLKTAFGGAIMAMWRVFVPFKGAIGLGLRMMGQSLLLFGKNIALMAGRFIAKTAQMIARAAVWAAQMVAAFVKIAIQAAITTARTIASLALMATKWVWAGARALFAAGRMAAAWFIALGPIGWVTAAIIGLVVLIIAKWDAISSTTKQVWSAVWTFIQSIWSKVVSGVSRWIANVVTSVTSGFNRAKAVVSSTMQGIWGVIQSIWSSITSAISSAVSSVVSFVTSGFNSARSTVSSVMGSILSTISSIWSSVVSAVSGAISNVKSVISGGLESALGIITGMGSSFLSAGRGLIEMMAQGISGAVSAVTGAVSNVVSAVRDFLPFSPAKVGPLSDLDKLDFGGPITDSVKKATSSVSREMAKMLAIPSMDIGYSTDFGTTGGFDVGSPTQTSNIPNNYERRTQNYDNSDRREVNINIDGADRDKVDQILETFTGFKQAMRKG